mgnify:CR=1 FL=1
MSKRTFQRVIEAILKDDNRYAVGAYVFVRMGLDYTVKEFGKDSQGAGASHVTAAQLLEGLRKFGLETFGPMMSVLLKEWNVKSCSDFGQIVFNMIKVGEMSKTQEDKIEDFDGVYDFYDAFERPFLPKSKGGI